MGKFYGGRSTVFPFGQTSHDPFITAPATVPIIRQGAVVPPESYPVGGVVPALPAGFPPYMIRPEVQGAMPQKQIVPPLFDAMTRMSFTQGIWGQTPAPDPTGVRGAVPLSPPSPVIPFFTTSASNAAQRAASENTRAMISAKRSLETQRRADDAAYHAQTKAAQAAMDPTPGAAGAADSAAALAAQLQAAADDHARQAMLHDQAAQAAAEKARGAAMKQAAAQDARDAGNADAVQTADDKATNQATDFIWPDGSWGPPTPQVDGSTGIPGLTSSSGGTSGYLMPVGGAAIAGFLALGPLGALIGAALGGGYAYVKSQRGIQGGQHNAYTPLATTPPIYNDIVVPQPQNYVGESFVPYQMPDGTFISNQQQQDAWLLAHPA